MNFQRSVRRYAATFFAFALTIGGVVMLAPAAIAGDAPSLQAQIITSTPDELSVRVSGSGYDNTAPGIYVGISESGEGSSTDASAYRGTVWVRDSQISAADGSFSTALKLDADAIKTLDKTKTYSIYTMKAHGSADRSQDVAKTLTLDFESLTKPETEPETPTGPTINADITKSTPTELSITVTGSGYATTAPGVYVALGDVFNPVNASVYPAVAYVSNTAMGADGTFKVTLKLDRDGIKSLDKAKAYSIYTFKAHGQAMTDPSQNVTHALKLDWKSLKGDSTAPESGPKPKPKPETGKQSKTTGYLAWGINASFRAYVTGNIAKGSIAVGAGAKAAGGAYRFPQSATKANAVNGIGSTSYRGTVAFNGHNGALKLNLSAPKITVKSRSSAALSMLVNGNRSTIATLNLTKAKPKNSNGTVTFSGIPSRLTSAGATAFSNFYSAGTRMAPVTFAIGASTKAAGGGLHTIAAAQTAVKWAAPSTPPSTEGLNAEFEGKKPVAGSTFTASASGFQPNETNIKVVVYSAPVILETKLTADAAGKASWSGLLPSSLEDGKHTLTFQGSVNRGKAFRIKAADTNTEFCKIIDANFSWGVKESFRAYISGSIANGEWTTNGKASYKTPVFTFADGHGGLDSAKSRGEIDFDGAIKFSGHDGALSVDLADPTLKVVDSKTAYLLFDTTSGSMAAATSGDSSTTSNDAVPIVKLDLSQAKLSPGTNGTTTAKRVPTALTSQGAEVFSNYPAGSDFDPIDLTITNSPDCANSANVADEIKSSAAKTSLAGTTGNASAVVMWLAAGAAAIALLGGGFALGRRKPDAT